MIVDEKMAGAAILCGEPLIGYSPTDIRQWLPENGHTDAAIAEAMAAVGQKVGWLHHELNDPDNDDAQISKYDKEFDAWWDMEKEAGRRDYPQVGGTESNCRHQSYHRRKRMALHHRAIHGTKRIPRWCRMVDKEVIA